MEKFVVINGRILDFARYESDFLLTRKIILLDMKDYLKKLGFKQVSGKNRKLLRQKARFYNAELDFEVTIQTNKKQSLQFV